MSDVLPGKGVIGGVGDVSGGGIPLAVLGCATATLGTLLYDGVGLLMIIPGPDAGVCANEDCELAELLLVGLTGLTAEMGECEGIEIPDDGFGIAGAAPRFVGVGIGVLCVELAAVNVSELGWDSRVCKLP